MLERGMDLNVDVLKASLECDAIKAEIFLTELHIEKKKTTAR